MVATFSGVSRASAIPDGATRVFVIIGDPVVQARAPAVWSALFAAQGINAICAPLQVTAGGLAAALRGIGAMKNIDGVTITVPHKVAAAAHVDHLKPVWTPLLRAAAARLPDPSRQAHDGSPGSPFRLVLRPARRRLERRRGGTRHAIAGRRRRGTMNPQGGKTS